jgi:DNA repair protein RadD
MCVCPSGFYALASKQRPTLSTGLYVQMVGRGTRRAEGKTSCLVLDFARNVWRHGPVDRVDPKSKSGTPGEAPVKACPERDELVPINTYTCTNCGYEWPRPAPRSKHATVADAVPVLSTGQSWLPVTDAALYVHHKPGQPMAVPSLRASYLCGLSSFHEYISFQRQGYARALAEKWWFAFGGKAPAPATVVEAIDRSDEIGRPVEIAVYRNDRWWNVSDRRVLRKDGTMVEIDRHLNCWIPQSVEAALETMRCDEVAF